MKLCKSSLCSDGYVFDSSVSRLVSCPLCDDIRRKEVSDGVSVDGSRVSLSETLGLRRVFSRLNLDLRLVLGATYDELKPEFRFELDTTLSSLVGYLSTGRKPNSSMLIYLGSQADVELFSYLILGSAFKAGLVTHSFITPFRLRKIKSSVDEYENLLMSDVVVATFSPSLREDSYLVEDLVKQRAYEGRATYIVLSDGVGLNSLISRLCSVDGTSLRKCVYVGIPNLYGDELSKIKRVNSVIRNSNKTLSMSIPEVEVDDDVINQPKPKGSSLRGAESRIYRR